MKDIAELLDEHRFFSDVDAAGRRFLAGCGRNVVVPAGTWMVREGDAADAFWAIRRGRVAVGVSHPARGLICLDTLGPGDMLGWSWMFPPYRWLLDARAEGTVGAVVFDATCIRDKCEADPALGYALARCFTRVLDERLIAARLRLLDLYGDQHLAG